MLENYLDIITRMENYVDGIIVTDTEADIVYIRRYTKDVSPLSEKEYIGHNLFEIYPTMDPSESTIMRALKEGKVTLNHKGALITARGQSFEIVDDTFPIKENGHIIGAVCITHSPSRKRAVTSLDNKSSSENQPKKLYTVSNLIGRSRPMETLRNQINRLAETSSSLLIYGETGTGKEMVAQSVHTSSSRKDKPFITQNCAVIPETLLESILFGTVKGSYTGAENRAGIFESASGGTVFLDEVNSMPISMQAKLLRVLEEKNITRIGATEAIDVDVRIIAALNLPPQDCVKSGVLRDDLFYRLGSVTISIPPLRERKEDIELLTKYFSDKFTSNMQKEIIGVSQDVMTIFHNYSWPGNVRELRNVIEGAFNLCDTTIIGIGDLPSYMLADIEVDKLVAENQADIHDIQWLGSLKNNMEAYEKFMISDALRSHKTLSAAAEYLGISRQNLNQKINKYKLFTVKPRELK